MSRASPRIALACGVLASLIAVGAAGQGSQAYRYIDAEGRTVYSDRPPPANARNVELKKLGNNVIESQAPLSTQQAQERYPVTLYTFACGELCRNAEGLLNKRGVPFATVNVSTPDGAEKLKRLTGGELQAPVLQVGDKLIAKGFSENMWQELLTDAGYPKTPPPRRAPPAKRPEATATAADKAKAPTTAEVPGSGYPIH